MSTPYDLEAVFDKKIAPLMEKIITICKEADLPFLASFAYAMDEDGGTDYCTSCRIAPADSPRHPRELGVAVQIIQRGLDPGELVRITGGPISTAFVVHGEQTP